MRKIETHNIPALSYEGYLWYSDEERPRLINGEFDINALTHQPFVVEGALCSSVEDISISIRWTENGYLIFQANCSEFRNNNYKCRSHEWFMAKDTTRKVKMEEIWKLEADPLCENMLTFRPAFWLFKGFVFV